MKKNKKIAICGVHGVGKSKICKKILLKIYNNASFAGRKKLATRDVESLWHMANLKFIPEQFREVVKDIPNFTKQTKEITLLTVDLYICDKHPQTLLKELGITYKIAVPQSIGNCWHFWNVKIPNDTIIPECISIETKNPFDYVGYGLSVDHAKNLINVKKQTEEITLATYGKQLYLENLYTEQGKNILCDRSVLDTFVYYEYFNEYKFKPDNPYDYAYNTAAVYIPTYSKIYIIEPSDREIEPDGFRLTDKKQKFEIHNLFLQYFDGFNNVEVVSQENADYVAESVVSEFVK